MVKVNANLATQDMKIHPRNPTPIQLYVDVSTVFSDDTE